MGPQVSVYTAPPEALLKLLTRAPHHPHALPLSRRMRFTTFPGGITEHTKILWASDVSLEDYVAAAAAAADGGAAGDGDGDGDGRREKPFAAAYLDFSRGPETELWIYSSLETRPGVSEAEEEEEEEEEEKKEVQREEIACAVALLREVKRAQDVYFAPGSAAARDREFPTILVGNVDEVLRHRLVDAGVAIDSTGLYDKFIFRVDELPEVRLPEALSDGRRMVWDRLRPEHIPFAISRSNIPRKERTVKLLPSTALYLEDGTPIAWAFLGECLLLFSGVDFYLIGGRATNY